MKGEETPAKRIGAALGRPSYTPMPQNTQPESKISTEPDTFEAYLHHIGKTGERLNRRRAKNLIHRDYTRLLTAALGTNHPALKAHAIETAEQYKKDSIRTYREIVGSPIHKFLKTIGLREEHGAGDTGTTELTNKYIERTPGQLPLDARKKVKKKPSDIIKNVVKEEVLSEKSGVGTTTRRTIRFQEKRRPSPAGRKVNLKRPTAKHNIAMRGPVAPKRPRPTTTAVGGKRIATKAARFATKQRIQTVRKTLKSQEAGSTLTRAARLR